MRRWEWAFGQDIQSQQRGLGAQTNDSQIPWLISNYLIREHVVARLLGSLLPEWDLHGHGCFRASVLMERRCKCAKDMGATCCPHLAPSGWCGWLCPAQPSTQGSVGPAFKTRLGHTESSSCSVGSGVALHLLLRASALKLVAVEMALLLELHYCGEWTAVGEVLKWENLQYPPFYQEDPIRWQEKWYQDGKLELEGAGGGRWWPWDHVGLLRRTLSSFPMS